MIRPEHLVLEVRDVNLDRVGTIPLPLVNLTATLRDGAPGEWKVSIPATHPRAADLRKPGAGIILSHVDRAVGTLMSGPALEAADVADSDSPAGVLEVTGTDDDALLWFRRAYPTPTAPATAQTTGYDTRTGTVEALMGAYVLANLGPAALEGRRVAGLGVSEDLGRGATLTVNARWDVLGDLLTSIAVPAGLRFRVAQVGPALQFQVLDRRDVTGDVRLDLRNGTLASQAASVTPPSLTHAIVLGQGDLAARTTRERTTDAGDLWGPWGRREGVIDSRQTNDPAALDLAGDKALLEGVGGASVNAVPGDAQVMAWPTAWGLGDTVAVVMGGRPYPAPVTEIVLSVGPDGARVGASIGTVGGWKPGDEQRRTVADLERRLAALERLVPAGTIG